MPFKDGKWVMFTDEEDAAITLSKERAKFSHYAIVQVSERRYLVVEDTGRSGSQKTGDGPWVTIKSYGPAEVDRDDYGNPVKTKALRYDQARALYMELREKENTL